MIQIFNSSTHLFNKAFSKYNQITRRFKPFPCISVKLKTLPPDILFQIMIVACATFGFLVFAPTSIPKKCAAILTAGLRNLFQAD